MRKPTISPAPRAPSSTVVFILMMRGSWNTRVATPNTRAMIENTSGRGAILRSTTNPNTTAISEVTTKAKVAVNRLWVSR